MSSYDDRNTGKDIRNMMNRNSNDNVIDISTTTFTGELDSTFFEGAILTGSEIRRQVELGNIIISNFKLENLNENSYNVTLNKTIMRHDLRCTDGFVIDPRNPCPMISTTISEKYGFVIQPGHLYLGSTNEIIGSKFFVPIIAGRSSFGRHGLNAHNTGNFGDLGFVGKFTLQINSIYPFRLFPNIRIAQIYFLRPYGRIEKLYNGKYQGATGPEPSKINREFNLK